MSYMNKMRLRYFSYFVTWDNFSKPRRVSSLLSYFSLNKYVIFYFSTFFITLFSIFCFSPLTPMCSIDLMDDAADFFSFDYEFCLWDRFSKECELDNDFLVMDFCISTWFSLNMLMLATHKSWSAAEEALKK